MISILITTREIPLTRGMVAIVDSEDYEWLNQWKWHLHPQGYAIRWVPNKAKTGPKSKTILMHRLIMNPEPNRHIDHVNGKVYDNRRENLRICSVSQNRMNQKKTRGKSKYKGVSWNKSRNSWVVSIKKDTKSYWLGTYKDEIEAALAYNLAAVQYHGEFARLNIV